MEKERDNRKNLGGNFMAVPDNEGGGGGDRVEDDYTTKSPEESKQALIQQIADIEKDENHPDRYILDKLKNQLQDLQKREEFKNEI